VPVDAASSMRSIQDQSGLFDETPFVLCGARGFDVDLTRMGAYQFDRARNGSAGGCDAE